MESVDTSTESPAELPGIPPPPQNEPVPESSSQLETPLFERIKRSGQKVFERHGVFFQRGRGRSRKDGAPKKSDLPLNAPVTALPPIATPAPAAVNKALDSALVQKCLKALAKGAVGFADKRLFNSARKADFSPSEAQQLVVNTTITEDELNAFSELGEQCLAKWGVDMRYALEIGLASVVLGVGLRYSVAFRGLKVGSTDKPSNEPAKV